MIMCRIETAKLRDFLDIAALDRIAWKHTGEQFIADGEHDPNHCPRANGDHYTRAGNDAIRQPDRDAIGVG